MGVGVRIVSENLNPKPGIAGEGKPLWRQKVMTETASVGKLTSGARKRSSRRRSSRRSRRKRSGGAAGGFVSGLSW